MLQLQYHSQYNDAETQREVEPVGLHHYRMGWHLIAFCRTRQDYRDFRVDRIREFFQTPYLEGLARWLLMYGNAATIEQPESLRTLMQNLVTELQSHYSTHPLID